MSELVCVMIGVHSDVAVVHDGTQHRVCVVCVAGSPSLRSRAAHYGFVCLVSRAVQTPLIVVVL